MEKQRASRTCFLCGRENDVGLKMTWYNDRDNGRVVTTVAVPEHFNGYPGIVHGGIVAALLDETSGRAVLLSGKDKLFVTASLDIRYRTPTPTEVPLTITGWTEKTKNNCARVAAEIRLPDGTVTAEASALVVKPPQDFFDKCNWEEEKEYWRVYDD